MISSVTVNDSSTSILAAPSGHAYKMVSIGNVGASTVYLKLVPGTTTVTVTNGIPLAANTSLVCDQDAQKELFDGGVTGICASGQTTTVSVQAV